MLDQTIVIYCICDEVVKSLGIKDDLQCRMNSAEVMSFAITAANLFYGDYRRAHLMARHHRYYRNILSISRLVRRIHSIPLQAWTMVFLALRVFSRNRNLETFIVDSMPIAAYSNHKSFRARIFVGKDYHGYSATRKQYFFGIKLHMVVDTKGVPIEFSFTPGSTSDLQGLRNMNLCLPERSVLYADRAYNDYEFEDNLLDIEKIRLIAKRKGNMKRQHSREDEIALSRHRNRIETVFSSISSRMPRHIKARTEKGFYLKITFFILAYMLNLFFPLV